MASTVHTVEEAREVIEPFFEDAQRRIDAGERGADSIRSMQPALRARAAADPIGFANDMLDELEQVTGEPVVLP